MKALYTAATGMSAQQTRLDNIANNVANVNTTGYKQSRVNFQDLFYQDLVVGGTLGQSRAQLGAGVRTVSIDKDHRNGSLTNTGAPLDVAISGRGFFVLEDPNGNTVYTRDGSLRVDVEGRLTNSQGLAVMGNVRIPPEARDIKIQADGRIEVQLEEGGDYIVVGDIPVAGFVNPAGLEAIGNNLFRESALSGQAIFLQPGVDTQIDQGFLESSNVDISRELIDMIMAQRSYELSSKVIQAADETLQLAANLRR